MMMPILKVVERLQAHEAEAAEKIGIGFALAAMEAARYLVEQGEKIVDLEQELATAKSEREYFRSRAAFFGELAKATTYGVISVEGFKAFRGTMRITPKAAVPAFELTGDWLYKPDTKCWYGKGSSFAADICTIVEVKQ